MSELSGTVTDGTTAVEGAQVMVVDTNGSSNPADWTVVGGDTSDSNGDWSVSGLAGGNERYHAIVQYDDGSTLYNAESLPYLTIPVEVAAPTTTMTINSPTPSIETGSAIPDSEDLQARYDFSKNDGSLPVADQTNNGFDLTDGSFSGVSRSINGVQAGEFDGVDDGIKTSTFSEITQPITFAVVHFPDSQTSSDGGLARLFDGSDSEMLYQHDDTERTFFAGSNLKFSTPPSIDPHIFIAVFDGTSSIMRIDGTTQATGDAGGNSLTNVTVGARGNFSGLYWDGLVGEVLVYDGDKSSIFSDIESYLSDKWGITL